jgi:hypothetical protein
MNSILCDNSNKFVLTDCRLDEQLELIAEHSELVEFLFLL